MLDEKIIKYIENGGSYWMQILTPDEQGELSQETISKYLENGGDLSELSKEQRSKKTINKYVEKGGDLGNLNDEEKAKLPQETIIKYVENGGWLGDLSKEQRANIPQESWIKYVENCGRFDSLSKEQLANIPLDAFAKRAGAGASIDKLTKVLKDIGQYEVAKIFDNWYSPYYSKEFIDEYAVGEIKSKDLPLECFAQPDARKELLDIFKVKIKVEFNDICEKNGFEKDVPEELIQAFDDKLKEVKTFVTKKKKEAEEKFLGEIKEMEERKKRKLEEKKRKIEEEKIKLEERKGNALNEIKEVEW